MKLYRIVVIDDIGTNGARLVHRSGEAVDVNGHLYVEEYGGGHLSPQSADWHETHAAAKRAAAAKLTGMASTLLAQAERLREEAAGV